MKLQASDASALEGLQSQNLSRPENRLSVNGLAIVHRRLIVAQILKFRQRLFRVDEVIE